MLTWMLPGVHVGVEEAVAKDLGEEDRHAVARQLRDVDAGLAQPVDLADRHAHHALHHDHLRVAVIPQHLGDQHQVQARHVAAQLRRAGGLAHEIQLVVQVLVELRHHLARLQPLAVIREPLDPAGHHPHEAQVLLDDVQHAGPQHLHGDVAGVAAAVLQRREVHLRDRGAGHRARARSWRRWNRPGGGTPARWWRWPRWSRTAARGPAAAPVRRRCPPGSRSRRVDSTWPNFTKIGPRCSSAWRRRWPRGARRSRPNASTRAIDVSQGRLKLLRTSSSRP